VPVELECKVRVESLAAPRERLRAAGAQRVARVLEENRLFDRPDGSLRLAGCGLRVRSVRVLAGTAAKATLTFKGPRAAGVFKQREEIEVEIDDAETMGGILRALGYAERVVFEKRRESWLLGPCRVELDELPELGTFVEVEGPDETAIRTALAAISLESLPPIARSYAAMAAELLEARPGAGRALRFPPSTSAR